MKARILIVDDEPAARSGLEKLLKTSDFEVASAVDGVSALEVATSFAPDVVITAIKMPNMDGAVQGSTTRAAELLDVSIRTIQYRLSEYGVAAKDLRK